MSLPEEILADKFELIGKISEGGMGAVYKVRHKMLGAERVLKVIHARYADDPSLRERFRREARTAIELRHPKIAETFDFEVGDDGTAYMEMEFIDGRTVESLLAAGPPPLPLSLEIALQALQALAFLHRKGYVHRDVAPDNLMLTRDHEGQPLVKLIDLGIAKRLEGDMGGRLTASGMFMGKALYCAPEQCAGKTVDARADIYSFGTLLYELLTGEVPFEGRTLSEILAAQLYHPPRNFDEADPRGVVPEDLRELVLRCLVKDRDERIASAEELSAALVPIQSRLAGVDLEETLRLDSRAILESAERVAVALTGLKEALRLEEDREDGPFPRPNAEERRLVLQRARADAAREVADLLAGGDVEAARERLRQARMIYGAVPVLVRLEKRVRDAGRMDEILEQVRDLAMRGKFKSARELLKEAQEIQPKHPEIAPLRRELQLARRKKQLRDAAAEVEQLAAKGNFKLAERKLAAAEKKFGEAPSLQRARARFEEGRRKNTDSSWIPFRR